MKPLKTLALIPILALVGFTAAQMTVPAAYGDDSVRVRASVLFNLNGGTSGFLSYGEPVYERIIEQPVVYVYQEPPRPIYIHEHTRPVVIVRKEYRDCDNPGRGHKYGHYKQAREVVVIEQNHRGNDRYERRDGRGGERYIQHNERFVQGNGRTVRYEDRNTRGDDRNTRSFVKQTVESRKGKHGK